MDFKFQLHPFIGLYLYQYLQTGDS
jgi:hypothetical protein